LNLIVSLMMKLRHSSADGAKRILKSSAFGVGWIVPPGLLCRNAVVSFAVVSFASAVTDYFYN
jgi:hypothetical protein